MADTRTDPQTELLDRHAEALALFGERVHAIADDQWDAPTPCTDWTVRDLVNHVVGEQRWVPPLVAEGRTLADIGHSLDGDLLGDAPVASWDTAAAAARAAFTAPGALDRTVPLSSGPTPGSAYCRELVCDCAVHTWDLSRAIGADERLPDTLVALATEVVTPLGDGLAASGMFAEPVPVPPDADAQTRLLGLLGRKA
ncbi:TIGR03086 family metal-binding protein [Streptomyces sp. WAC06614]|uniref:TIGR03086 family metal-binding protein n=1 Tax=Streptomyces sp. WAC06614 TaxID=2487416 RepID=UPI0021B0847E|nr:TIGR03086 family metal-binding protein [Streptomyces sp. WAC06614]